MPVRKEIKKIIYKLLNLITQLTWRGWQLKCSRLFHVVDEINSSTLIKCSFITTNFPVSGQRIWACAFDCFNSMLTSSYFIPRLLKLVTKSCDSSLQLCFVLCFRPGLLVRPLLPSCPGSWPLALSCACAVSLAYCDLTCWALQPTSRFCRAD